MKQTQYKSIKESQNNIIYPIYEEQTIPNDIIETLGYDLNQSLDKSYNQITKIHTLGKYPFDYIYFIGLGSSQKITTMKMRKAFENIYKNIK